LDDQKIRPLGQIHLLARRSNRPAVSSRALWQQFVDGTPYNRPTRTSRSERYPFFAIIHELQQKSESK
jgi:hypothetical protein